jgi:hypothetical protein
LACLAAYTPSDTQDSDGEEDTVEQELVRQRLAAKGIFLQGIIQDDNAEKIAHPKPGFHEFDPWWVAEEDEEGREIASSSLTSSGKLVANWTAEHGLEEDG